MDFQEIQDKLNTLLSGERRRVVFWYDDDGSYETEIDKLRFGENCRLWRLTQTNHFATKLLLAIELS